MNNINKEMITQRLGEYLLNYILENPPDYEKIAEQKGVLILSELQTLFLEQEVITDDFLLVDRIVSILNKHGIDTGVCHDF